MAGRRIERDEIIDILYGATYFGGGGGGALQSGLDMLELVPAEKQHFDLVPVAEMGNSYSAMAAGLGSPLSMEELGFSDEAVYVIQGMIDEAKKEGKSVDFIYSGEMGGFNTMVPLYAAMQLNMPVIDTDGNGRAVPELNTGLLPIYKIPTSPLVLANKAKDIIVGHTADPLDSVSCETIARQMCMAYHNSIGFSTWLMNQDQHRKASALGQITLAGKVGKLLRDPGLPAEKLAVELNNFAKTRQVLAGKITKIDVKTENGFDFGTTTITAANGHTATIEFKNENLLIRRDDGEVLVTVPEIISIVRKEDKLPLSNADTEVGQEVLLLATHADEKWWAIPEGYTCWSHILKLIGYSVVAEAKPLR